MRKLIILTIALLMSLTFEIRVSAQTSPNGIKRCSSMDVLERLKKEDPQLEVRMQKIEREVQTYIASGKHQSGERAVIYIPTVVHVVYNTTSQNISDAQIQSQIKILNDDFRRLNADKVNTPSAFASIAADCQIEFCLASKDPNGNATTGITRTSTSTTSFVDDDRVKSSSTGGKTGWASGSYLNIWVCNLGGGLLGYAQFPGGPSSTDGVVMGHKYFGNTGTATAPFNKGRTATHEVGHWLNLYHIWGDAYCGNDNVSDTPTQQVENYGCPTFPKKTCSNSGDMHMNYMDYTDDACMNLFSLGQSSRMNATLNGSRASLKTATGCGAVTPTTCSVPTGLSSSSITSSSATISWTSTGAASYNVQYKTSAATTWTTTTSTTTSKGLSGLSASTTYNFKIQGVCTSSSSSYSTTSSFTTSATSTSGCGYDAYESNETKSTAKAITTGSNKFGLICPATDVDWLYFSNSSTYPNIRVTLSTLPGDYDLYLYNSSGTLVKKSENGGTTSEKVIYNAAPVGSYYIKIIGYGGAFSSTVKYTLLASRSSVAYTSRLDGEEFAKLEFKPFDDLKVYPNPAKEKLVVQFNHNSETNFVIEVRDIMGKNVLHTTFSAVGGENIYELDINELSNGIYMLNTIKGDDKVVKKFVVLK